MLKKPFQRKLLIITMGVLIVLSLSLFLYWRTFNNAVISRQVNTKDRPSEQSTVSEQSPPNSF